MKIFPSHKYSVELNENWENSITNLKNYTFQSSSLYSHITDKKFIGTINDNNFKIIGSEIGIGAFTVFLGSFNGMSGIIETKVNVAFRILISVIYVLPLLVVVWTMIDYGIVRSIGLLVPLIMGFLFIRFVFIGLFYKFSSNIVMQKLKVSLGIKSVNLMK